MLRLTDTNNNQQTIVVGDILQMLQAAGSGQTVITYRETGNRIVIGDTVDNIFPNIFTNEAFKVTNLEGSKYILYKNDVDRFLDYPGGNTEIRFKDSRSPIIVTETQAQIEAQFQSGALGRFVNGGTFSAVYPANPQIDFTYNDGSPGFFVDLLGFITWLIARLRSYFLYEAIVDSNGTGDYTTTKAAIDGGATSIFVRESLVPYVEAGKWDITDSTLIKGENSNVICVFGAGEGIDADSGGVLKGGGTIAVTQGSDVVVGTGTAFAPSDVGRTIKIGIQFFTISAYNSGTNIEIDRNWEGVTIAGLSYSINDYINGFILDTLSLVGGGASDELIKCRAVLNGDIKNIYADGSSVDNILIEESGTIGLQNVVSKDAGADGLKINLSTGVKASKVSADNCTVNGIGVTNSDGTSLSQCFASNNISAGVDITGGGDTMLSNVNVSYNRLRGIDLDNSTVNATVDGCVCIKNGTENIQNSSVNATISNCSIDGDGTGVGIRTVAKSRTTGNFIKNCTTGIELGTGSAESLCSDNDIEDCPLGIFAVGGQSDINDNRVKAFQVRGIYVLTQGDNNLSGNRVYGGTGGSNRAFEIATDGNTLDNNRAYSNQRGYFITGNSNTLSDNKAHTNSTADYDVTGSDNEIDHQVFNKVSTTDATLTTIATIPIGNDNTQYSIRSVTQAMASDQAEYGTWVQTIVVKKVATVVTIDLTNNDLVQQTGLAAGSVTAAVSGSNILVQVTGNVGDNIDWRNEHFFLTKSSNF
jgi:parallel beta-helix repeat protein